MKKISNILIVCSGNTARSPAGEYLGRYYAKQYNIDLLFDSAGFFNAFSYMQPDSQDYLKSKGIDPSGFHPKVINKNLLEKQDLIITMEESHADQIRNNFRNIPSISDKTFTLKEFNGETRDIDIIDPYYTDRTTYMKVMKELDHYIEKLVKKVIEVNKKSQ